MLKKLFMLENIRYIISVDDCFANHDEELRERLLVETLSAFENFKPFFIKVGKEKQVNDIQDLIDLKADARSSIQSLIESLQKSEMEECLQAISPGSKVLSEEKKSILGFLETLKAEGTIKNFYTIASTHAAVDFDISAHGMTDGAILWLIDKSFSKVSESDVAGIELAKSIIKQEQATDNFVFMLTSIDNTSDSEEDIEIAFDKVLAEDDIQTTSFIYYISKNLVITKKYDRIAKSLSYGFKRKQCYKLINDYIECLQTSCNAAIKKLLKIDQKTLNYVFTEKVQENGESYFDFFNRLVQIFHEDEYGNLLTSKRKDISTKLSHYQNLCNDIPQKEGNFNDVHKSLAVVRKKELFDIYVNKKHSEVSTGDIFKINSDYYILVTQSCDTYLRKDGKRKLNNAILLKILDSPDAFYKYELSCFYDLENSFKKAFVIFQDNCIIPFEILDLCVANEDGRACIDTTCFEGESSLDNCFTSNYKLCYEKLTKLFSDVYEKKILLDKFLDNLDAGGEIDKIKEAYKYMLNTDSFIKDFKIEGTSMLYPIQRISRLNELNTVALLNEYGYVLSRVGHPFDFMQEKRNTTSG